MKILESKRLIVSEATVHDADFLYQLLNSPAWLRYIGDRGVRSSRDAAEYIERNLIASYSKNGYGLFKLTDKQQSEPAGVCGFIKRDYLPSPDIGFALLPQYEGKGFAFEASEALLNYGRTEWKMDPVLAITTEDNDRSKTLLHRLGLREDGKVRPTGSEKELLLFTDRQVR